MRLLEILCPRATRYTFVPVGGKDNVIRVVKELRENLSEALRIEVLGIVDKDRADAVVEGIAAWGVSAIENLLLDVEAIASVWVGGPSPGMLERYLKAADHAASSRKQQ